MNRAQRRAKPHLSRTLRREPPMIVKLQALFAPVEAILDEIERTGCTDTARGIPGFQPPGANEWYESAPTMLGIAEIFAHWARDHGAPLPVEPLQRFARKLAASMPVTLDDIRQARAAIGQMKHVPLTRGEGYRYVRDCQIKDVLEGRSG